MNNVTDTKLFKTKEKQAKKIRKQIWIFQFHNVASGVIRLPGF